MTDGLSIVWDSPDVFSAFTSTPMIVGAVSSGKGSMPVGVTVDNDDRSVAADFKESFETLFSNSPTLRNLAGNFIANNPGSTLQVRIVTGANDESGIIGFDGHEIMLVASAQTKWLYRSEVPISIPGSAGYHHEFTLVHIIGHEFVHLFTGMEDTPEFNAIVNRVIFEADGSAPRVDNYYDVASPPDHCFLAGTQVSMWDGTKKPIEQIEAGDIVVSYDKNGNLKPGRVKRNMTNRAKQILDVHGLMVTPGHATLCGDGRFNGQHVPILDILRSDGALVQEDGTKIRVATGCPLGTMGDRMITAIIGEQQPDGLVRIAEVGQIRAGTRFIREDGDDVSVLDMILKSGGRLTEDGMIQTSANGPKMPFRWTFTSSLPKPEDYVLQRSATHLQDIYMANEWESVRPSMPIPMGGEAGATLSRHPVIVAATPVNVPLALRNRPDAPQMSRKYRRAAEAKAQKKRKYAALARLDRPPALCQGLIHVTTQSHSPCRDDGGYSAPTPRRDGVPTPAPFPHRPNLRFGEQLKRKSPNERALLVVSQLIRSQTPSIT